MKTVLFLCTHNSARSQMAEGFLNKFYGDRFRSQSAGTHPTKINSIVIKVMAEEGIDLSKARSKSVKEFVEKNFDLVVTVCDDAREACPFFPSDTLIHHSFRDPSSLEGPKEDVLAQVRKIRDEIKAWIQEYFAP